MKKKFLLSRWRATGLLFLFLLLAATSPCRASVFELNGQINASQIPDNSAVLVTGKSTITVDCNKTIKCIAGYGRTLVIQFNGSGYSFNVVYDQNEGIALSASSLTVQGNGLLKASGDFSGIYVKNLMIKDNAKVMALGNSKYHGGIECRVMDIYDSNVYARSRGYGILLFDSQSKITMHSGKLTAIGTGYAGYTSPNGLYGYPSGWGITSGGIKNFDNYMSYADGTLDVQGGEVVVQSKHQGGVVLGTVNVSGGSLTVNSSMGGGKTSVDEEGAIQCYTMNVSGGEVNANGNRDGIHVKGALTVTGGKVLGDGGKSPRRGIYSEGEMIFSGLSEVTGSGSNYGIYSENDITVNNKHTLGTTRADGFTYGIYSEKKIIFPMGSDFESCDAYSKEFKPYCAVGGLEFQRPWKNIQGFIVHQGDNNCFENPNSNSVAHGTITICRPSLFNWQYPSTNNAGLCTNTSYVPGSLVTLTVPQAIVNYVNCADAVLSVQWWGSSKSNPDVFTLLGTSTVTGNQHATFQTTSSQRDSKMYAVLTYDTHTDYLISNTFDIKKNKNNLAPEAPDPIFRYSKVWLKNAKTDQEYLVLTTQKEPGALTANDWANAEQPTQAGSVQLSTAVTGSVCYVYTRFKETSSLEPGTVVEFVTVYGGSTTELKDIELTATGVGFDLQPECPSYHVVPLNSVVRFDLSPVPSSVENFMGLPATWGWTFTNPNSSFGKLYSDAACTQEINFTNWDGDPAQEPYIKTAYAKFTQTTKGKKRYILSTSYSVFSGMSGHDSFNVCVANPDGTYNPSYMEAWNRIVDGEYYYLLVPSGVITAQEIIYRPLAASLEGVTFKYTDGYGNEISNPQLSVSIDAANKLLLVDATNTPVGYIDEVNFYMDGEYLGSTIIRVAAPTPQGIEVTPGELTLDPLDTECQLHANFVPANAATNTPIEWSSSNTALATVDQNGKVTMIEAADINSVLGESVTITATCGDLSGSAVIHISGEKYPLWVKGTQVTSMNKYDIFGDRKVSYEGGQLTINGYNASITNKPYLKTELPTLLVNVRGSNIATSSSTATAPAMAQMINTNVHFIGNGTLKMLGQSTNVLSGLIANNITVSDTVTVEAKGRSYGVAARDALAVYDETATVRAYGTADASILANSGIIGNVVDPAGAAISFVESLNGYSVTSEGSPVLHSWVTINGVTEQSGVLGDVDGDGKVDVSDVNAAINIILELKDASEYAGNADLNGDGKVDVSDVNAIINIILSN